MLTIQFSRNLQRGIVEMAVDARKESKVQDSVLSGGGGKKCKKKNKKAEDGVSEKVSTNNKNIIIRSVDLNGST
jgi:hypothetical protein